MRKSILMTLGLMLGIVGLVSALDKQAEITGASNYKNLSFTTTQTNIFDGDGVVEGIIIASATITNPNSYIVLYDTATGVTGSEMLRINITTAVVLGGSGVYTVNASGGITNFQYKFVTPLRVNRGLAAANSSVDFKSMILYKRLGN